ncbi:hypothetical protein B1757_04635 [Acidithiobacillus marinus]|uniref:Uncharacterized protein n=1 Tax=Acidithiobacillus marinus TaxID=187490 RepID=A0A2I1DNR8_9PROT|nr:hypothetical protein B1757_04635 [Acidithiobacillus marinus]
MLPLSIRYTERLADAGVAASVGSTGDSDDNALAETINGKRLSNPLLRVGADQANADFFQFHGKSSWSRLLGQVGSFSSTSQR